MAFTNQTVSIAKTFEYYYQVPEYQRGYVWDEEKITEFLGAIVDDFKDSSEQGYFIGAAVFEDTEIPNKYYVVDGQQRLTSVFIIISAAYNILKEHDFDKANLDSVCEEFLRKYSRRDKRTTLKISHTDKKCSEALNAIVDDKDQTPIDANSSSERIYVAYRAAKKRLLDEFFAAEIDDGVESVANFIDHFEKINILPFISQSREESLTVFETLNSKGVGLSSLDILKSLLFDAINGREDSLEWDELNQKWNSFMEVFEPLKMPPNKFLRYVITTQYGSSSPAAKCLGWFKDNAESIGLSKNPLGVIEILDRTARCIKSIRLGNGPSGQSNMYLKNMRSLAPSAEQQYFLILPNWKLDGESFDLICALAESQVFVNKILAHYTGATEKNFIEWGRNISQLGNDVRLIRTYLEENIWVLVRKEFDKLEAVLTAVALTNTPKSLVKWMLQRCELFAAITAKEDFSKGVLAFEPVDIEHIEPQSSDRMDTAKIQLFGNLTLHEKGLNRGNGKAPYEAKENYRHSRYYMTKALKIGAPQVGGANKKAYELFYTAESWGVTEILERTTKLAGVLLKALNLSR